MSRPCCVSGHGVLCEWQQRLLTEWFTLIDSLGNGWVFTIPAIEPCDVVVIPVTPELVDAAKCGVEAIVKTTETEGITYTSVRVDDKVTITATANKGFVFAEGSITSWEFTIPAIVPCDVVVTPVAPVFADAAKCGVEATVTNAETEGITYTQTREGAVVTVRAEAKKGFTFAEGAVTVWSFTIPEIVPCDEVVTPVEPKLVPAAVCGIEGTISITDVKGVTYKQDRVDNKVTITATADKGFVLEEGAVAVWEITIPAVVPCDETVTPVIPILVDADKCGTEATIKVTETKGVVYTQERKGQTVVITAKADKGFVITDGAVTSWTIEIPEVKPCDVVVTPVAPELSPADKCGTEGIVKMPETAGVVYTLTRVGGKVTIEAKAKAGFVFAEGAKASWVIEIPAIKDCAPVVTPEKVETPKNPLASTGPNISMLGLGGLLLISGVVSLLVTRKRRKSNIG